MEVRLKYRTGLYPFLILAWATRTAQAEAVIAPAPVVREAQVIYNEDAAKDLKYMALLLESYQMESRRYRGWDAALRFASAGIEIPVGGDVLGRGHAVSGAILLARGGLDLGSGLLDLVSEDPLTRLRSRFLERVASNAGPDEILAVTGHEWDSAAQSARRARKLSGSIGIGVGTAMLGFGTVVALNGIHFTSRSSTQSDRALLGTLFMALGSTNLFVGLRSLLVPEPIEGGWQNYQLAHSIWLSTRVSILPLQNGVFLGVSAQL